LQISIILDPTPPADGSNSLSYNNRLRDGGEALPQTCGATILRGALKSELQLPAVTRADSKLMHHVATLMHNSTCHDDALAATFLPGSLFLKTAGVVVLATANQAPVFLGEMEIVATATGHPVLLLRRSLEASFSGPTADLLLPNPAGPSWYFEYRLFRALSGDSWLVPSGSGPSVRLMQHGLFVSDHAPYADPWDYDAGLQRAAEHLASHRIGGWSW
jgi:hypothetical protein